MSSALEELVVLDLTTAFWSSVGSALLGDFGARVIRVENLPESRAEPVITDEPSVNWDYEAELAQRNKRSLALDLEQESGQTHPPTMTHRPRRTMAAVLSIACSSCDCDFIICC